MSKQQEDQSEGQEKDNKDKAPPTMLIWTVRGISLALVLGILGYLVFETFQPVNPTQFSFRVKSEEIEKRNDRWVVPVNVVNEGSISCHDLKYSITLMNAPDQPTKEVTLAMIGPHESVSYEIWFDENPIGKGIECRVLSYLLP